MPIASFGKKTFTVNNRKVYTLDEFSWTMDLNTEAQEKAGSKPSTYIKGGNLGTMEFSVKLNASFGVNPRKEIESWIDIMEDETPYLFILGKRPVGDNKWLLKSVNTSDTLLDGNGLMIKATIQLSFEEYVRPGSAAASKKSSKKKSGKAPAVAVNISPSNYIDKSSKKRNNINASAAVSKGKKVT